MAELITFPIQASCNKNARRNVALTLFGGIIVAIVELLRTSHCVDCSRFLNLTSQIGFLGVPVFISLVLIQDRPAEIMIRPTSIDVQYFRFFGFGKLKPFTVSTSDFRYLTYKPVMGGPAVVTPLSPFAIGGGGAIRLVLRGKHGISDVVFDLPANVQVERFSKDMPILWEYMRRLGDALNLSVRDEIREQNEWT